MTMKRRLPSHHAIAPWTGALALLLLPLAAFAQQKPISPEQAADSVGKRVVVQAAVAQASYAPSSQTTFLNFCKPFPDHCFSAVVFKSAQAEFPNARDLTGKTVQVSGEVKMSGQAGDRAREEGAAASGFPG